MNVHIINSEFRHSRNLHHYYTLMHVKYYEFFHHEFFNLESNIYNNIKFSIDDIIKIINKHITDTEIMLLLTYSKILNWAIAECKILPFEYHKKLIFID